MAVTEEVASRAGCAGGAALCPVHICVPVVAVLIVTEAPIDVAAVDVLDPPFVWDDAVPVCSDMAFVLLYDFQVSLQFRYFVDSQSVSFPRF